MANDMASIGHSVWPHWIPCLAPVRLPKGHLSVIPFGSHQALCLAPLGTPFGPHSAPYRAPIRHSIWPSLATPSSPHRALCLALLGTPSSPGYLFGTGIPAYRFWVIIQILTLYTQMLFSCSTRLQHLLNISMQILMLGGTPKKEMCGVRIAVSFRIGRQLIVSRLYGSPRFGQGQTILE